MSETQKDEMLETLRALQKGLDGLEAQRVKLIHSRRLVMGQLHRTCGVSLREIGSVCDMSAAAVAGNLARLDADLATANQG